MPATLDTTYLKDIRSTALHTARQERDLAERIAVGDPEARETLIEANLRLVITIALGFDGRGLPLDDLVAEGNLGLIRAAESFSADAGTRFSTYAAYWIKNAIRSAIQAQAHPIAIPAYTAALTSKWRRASVTLAARLGRQPTPEEIGRALRLTKRKVAIALQAVEASALKRLHARDEDGDADDPSYSVADARIPSPDVVLGEAEDVERILGRFERLDAREATVIRMRFGLEPYTPMTLREIGDSIGITRERVRQIETIAMGKLGDDEA